MPSTRTSKTFTRARPPPSGRASARNSAVRYAPSRNCARASARTAAGARSFSASARRRASDQPGASTADAPQIERVRARREFRAHAGMFRDEPRRHLRAFDASFASTTSSVSIRGGLMWYRYASHAKARRTPAPPQTQAELGILPAVEIEAFVEARPPPRARRAERTRCTCRKTRPNNCASDGLRPQRCVRHVEDRSRDGGRSLRARVRCGVRGEEALAARRRRRPRRRRALRSRARCPRCAPRRDSAGRESDSARKRRDARRARVRRRPSRRASRCRRRSLRNAARRAGDSSDSSAPAQRSRAILGGDDDRERGRHAGPAQQRSRHASGRADLGRVERARAAPTQPRAPRHRPRTPRSAARRRPASACRAIPASALRPRRCWAAP